MESARDVKSSKRTRVHEHPRVFYVSMCIRWLSVEIQYYNSRQVIVFQSLSDECGVSRE